MPVIMYGGPDPDWNRQRDWNQFPEKVYVDRPLNEEEIRRIIKKTIKEIDVHRQEKYVKDRYVKTLFDKIHYWLLKQVTNIEILVCKFKGRNKK